MLKFSYRYFFITSTNGNFIGFIGTYTISLYLLISKNFQISLIDRVHKIYNDTIWQDRQELDGFKGMGFVIKKIVVHSEPTRVRPGESHYNMVREKWDVRNLLEVSNFHFSAYLSDCSACRFSVANTATKTSAWLIYSQI